MTSNNFSTLKDTMAAAMAIGFVAMAIYVSVIIIGLILIVTYLLIKSYISYEIRKAESGAYDNVNWWETSCKFLFAVTMICFCFYMLFHPDIFVSMFSSLNTKYTISILSAIVILLLVYKICTFQIKHKTKSQKKPLAQRKNIDYQDYDWRG